MAQIVIIGQIMCQIFQFMGLLLVNIQEEACIWWINFKLIKIAFKYWITEMEAKIVVKLSFSENNRQQMHHLEYTAL